MIKERGRIIDSGMGGFLNPPQHPEHDYSVETDLRRRPENRGGMSLTAAVKSEWLVDDIRAEAQQMLDYWQETKPSLEDAEIKDWIAQVLGYFRNCYKGQDDGEYGRGPWSAEALIVDASRNPLPNADDHAGVHYIREFYPEYTPTKEDFDAAFWGAR